MKTRHRLLVFAALLTAGNHAVAQSTLRSDQTAFFESKIRPVLIESCYKCHSETSAKIRGGLLLDSREGTRRGGDNGPAVVPGDLNKSLLIEAIRHTNKDTAMPPQKDGGKLPDAVIADFEQWVKMGAPDPRDGKAPVAVTQTEWSPDKAKKWWSFQPLQPPPVPLVEDASWPRGDVDRYVLAGLEAKGLRPVGDADKLTLLRRLCFDLAGLPPSPEMAKQFLANKSPNAVAELVDSLLESRQFGERWGRHWLDVARYAESTGKDLNVSLPHAWRYRDYVIAAFNKDKPYDQFIREQIAGDLLPAKDARGRAEQLIATGFLAVGPKGLGELTPRQYELDLADEQIDATSQAFLGLTVACARCHDHKFDPISQRDYYAMAGIFLSSEVSYGTLSGPKNNQERGLIALPKEAGMPAVIPSVTLSERAQLQQEYNDAKARYDGLMAQRSSPGAGSAGAPRRGKGGAMGGGSGPQFFIQVQIALGKMADLESRLNSFDEQGHAKAFCMGVQDRPAGTSKTEAMRPTKVVEIKGSSGIRPPSGFETIADSPLFIRGEMNEPGERVPRGFPAALTSVSAPVIPPNTSGRKELADWIASPRHALTARVMANRIWHWLLGAGLVESVDNLGTQGTPPANQALLDHLAVRLVRNQWSIKATIREVVLSRTYQLASTHDAASYAADPENKLLWRRDKQRLDAECIRDAMLAASGQLQLTPIVGSEVAVAGDGPIGSTGGFIRINEDTLVNATANYRSVYLPIARDLLPDALAVFDYSDASLVMGAREQTNVPAQALYLLNNDFVREQAEKFAKRITAGPTSSTDQRIIQAYALALSRQPSMKEMQTARTFLDRERGSGNSADEALSIFCLALFASAEFRFLN
ncbi:cytochrome c [Roseimicrobium gellanilyticum]|uniref:Cytochrome c n=1 Tax=Roseimicrobium gellanilyticum TaxID=748857 RepID=A0A366H2Y4_9BACT|nr:PSD1 and planctomycete cytochrome C domain-containing protein [Roseimicrobium gellanilyticum]RBP35636.1 cytochrome c [Roseimicrobium gellanilyticum]